MDQESVKRGLVFLFVVLFVGSALAQIEEQVQVNLIEIWAKVTDKDNNVVTDLKPEEFKIYIDGKEMEIRCFDKTFEEVPEVVDSGQRDLLLDPYAQQGPKRKYIFFFDLLHSSARDIDYLKRRIADFLETSFDPQDQGMVFVLLPSAKLGIVQRLTNNKEALISVVNKMRGNASLENQIRDKERELLHLLYAFGASGIQGAGGMQGASSRAPESTIRQARGLARTFAAQEKNLSKITLNSFLTIADYLSGNPMEGRLVMIYVSGGFSLRPGQNYFDMIQKAIEDTSTVGSDDLVFQDHPDEDFEKEVRKAIGLLNRLNVTIYSIDSNGLVEGGIGVDRDSQTVTLGIDRVSYTQELQDSLNMVARETGGLVFSNSQNFQRGLGEITSDMNQQYWLCSNMPPAKKQGSYHKIEVKVTRPGLKVRHRRGYVD